MTDAIKKSESLVYGCWNTQRKLTYLTSIPDPSGPYDERLQVKVANLLDRNSRLCKYDLSSTDPKCVGCKKPTMRVLQRTRMEQPGTLKSSHDEDTDQQPPEEDTECSD